MRFWGTAMGDSGKFPRAEDRVLWRDQTIENALSAPRPEQRALAVVARVGILSSLERIRVLTKAPTVEALLALDHGDVEMLVERAITGHRWDPAAHLRRTDQDLQWLSGPRRELLWVGDRDYPRRLHTSYDPPAGLYTWGSVAALDPELPPIAVVGTRRPDDEGLKAAFSLGAEAAEHGVPVVSGLALGIDAAAHRGVVAAGRPEVAIAVLGTGIDTVYPRRNREFAMELVDRGGALVSEYPPGTPPQRYRFPARNRIIAALAELTVIVQAPEGSGALYTARYADGYNRTVLVHESGLRYGGSSELALQGSAVIRSFQDVMAQLAEAGYRIPSPQGEAIMSKGNGDGPDIDTAYRRDEARKLALFGEARPPRSLNDWRAQMRKATV